MECMFSEFAGDAKLVGAGDTLKDGIRIQNNLDNLEKVLHVVG